MPHAQANRTIVARRIFGITAGLITIAATIAGIVSYGARLSARNAQLQIDPDVATVWEAGVTTGPVQRLHRSNPLQDLLSKQGIRLFGGGATFVGRYQGDPSGLEIWFDYDSHLPQVRQLECHRVGETAFVDDLGQPYHGLLDLHSHLVGVYLPGYDHAAHQLMCAVHWMPRRPADPKPTSRPMLFRIDLPPAKRVLPPLAALPHGPLTISKQGVTVTVARVSVSGPNLSVYQEGQRELRFKLTIRGGVLADANLGTPALNPVAPTACRFSVSDPYGAPLLPARGLLFPQPYAFDTGGLPAGEGMRWVAGVNGAGKGTDAVRLQFDVRPDRSAASVHFDLVAPVETEDEV